VDFLKKVTDFLMPMEEEEVVKTEPAKQEEQEEAGVRRASVDSYEERRVSNGASVSYASAEPPLYTPASQPRRSLHSVSAQVPRTRVTSQQERPKLVVEAHGYYFLLPGTPGKQLVHAFPPDVYAVPSAMSVQRAAIYYFHSSGDPGGVSALGHTVELQSPHYSLDVIIDEAGRVRTEGRHL